MSIILPFHKLNKHKRTEQQFVDSYFLFVVVFAFTAIGNNFIQFQYFHSESDTPSNFKQNRNKKMQEPVKPTAMSKIGWLRQHRRCCCAPSEISWLNKHIRNPKMRIHGKKTLSLSRFLIFTQIGPFQKAVQCFPRNLFLCMRNSFYRKMYPLYEWISERERES